MNNTGNANLIWERFEPSKGRAGWRAKCSFGQWDGDESGHEWTCGYSVYSPGQGQNLWELYEDDGKGNGRFICSRRSLDDAQAAAEEHNLKSAPAKLA